MDLTKAYQTPNPYPFNTAEFNRYLDRGITTRLNAVLSSISSHPGVNNGGYRSFYGERPAPQLSQKPAVKRLPSGY